MVTFKAVKLRDQNFMFKKHIKPLNAAWLSPKFKSTTFPHKLLHWNVEDSVL